MLDKVVACVVMYVVRDARRVNFLSLVHYLLPFKDVLVEDLLELFVREIDAELLKAVLLEHFEAKYIEETCEVSSGDTSRISH